MFLTLVFGMCFAVVGTIAQWPSRVDFRVALLDAIAAARLTPKDIYIPLRYSQSQWAKIMLGEPGHRLPSLDRLEELPPVVWDELLPRLAYVVWTRRQQSEVRSL